MLVEVHCKKAQLTVVKLLREVSSGAEGYKGGEINRLIDR
jgi:hypothetical protein